MEVLNIRNSAFTPINIDNGEWDLAPNVITQGNNVRFNFGRIWSYQGYRDYATSNINSDQYWMLYVDDSQDYIMTLGEGVAVFDGANWFDIGMAPPAYDSVIEDQWSGGLLGGIAIVSAPGTFPQYWPDSDTGNTLEYLPWDGVQTWEDVGNTCRILRTFKQFAIAMDIQEGVLESPDVVLWSNPAESRSVPDSWDFTNPANLAGRNVLSGNLGRVIDGQELRDTFVIYRERGLTVMDFVGGTFVFNFRNLTSTYTLAGLNCIVEAEGVHYFLTSNDICIFDGNSIQSIAQNEVRSALIFFFDANRPDAAFVVKNDDAKEILFCIPTPGNEGASLALIYNWHDKVWGAKQLDDNRYGVHIPILEEPITWANVVGQWDSQNRSWNNSGGGVYRDTLMLGKKIQTGVPSSWDDMVDDWDSILNSWSTYNTGGEIEDTFANLQSFSFPNVNTSDQCLIGRSNLAIAGHDTVVTVTRIYPHFTPESSPVFIKFGAQDFVGGPIRWKAPVEFKPGVDRKIDLRVTGELIAYQIYSNSPGSWQYTGMDIEWSLAGKR